MGVNNKELKFVNIISVLFLAVLMIITFFSVLYLSNGEKAISSLVSVIIVISYYFIIELLKKNKELLKKNKYLHYSAFFWLLFFGLAFTSFYLMLHLLSIEINCKQLIQDDADKKLTIIENKVLEYKRKANQDLIDFPIDLRAKLSDYKNNHRNNALKKELLNMPYKIDQEYLDDYSDIDPDGYAIVETSVRALVIKKNIMQLDSMVKKQLNPQRIVFQNWDRMNLVESYNNLNKFVSDKQNEINKLIVQLPISNSFSVISIDYSQLPLNNPPELQKRYQANAFIPILAIILIHFFILIPYFNLQTKDYNKSKSKGVKEY
jgi:hypothetical protein